MVREDLWQPCPSHPSKNGLGALTYALFVWTGVYSINLAAMLDVGSVAKRRLAFRGSLRPCACIKQVWLGWTDSSKSRLAFSKNLIPVVVFLALSLVSWRSRSADRIVSQDLYVHVQSSGLMTIFLLFSLFLSLLYLLLRSTILAVHRSPLAPTLLHCAIRVSTVL